jgi:membrane associated rhomboid family serine protease
VFLPYNVDVPMARVPFANWILMGVTVLISLVLFLIYLGERNRQRQLENPPDLEQQFEEDEGLPKELARAARKNDDVDVPFPGSLKRGRDFSVFQLLSYMFAHAGPMHLIGNMLFLFVFGNAVNAKLGHGLFLACYVGLGILAGLAWLAMGHGREMVGASGAIMGLVGIFFILFPKNDVSSFYWFSFAYMGSVNIPAFLVILFYMLGDLFGTLMSRSPVAYVAHLIGSLGGIIIAIVLVSARWVKSTKYEENLLEAVGILRRRKRYDDDYWEQKKKRPKRLPQP